MTNRTVRSPGLLCVAPGRYFLPISLWPSRRRAPSDDAQSLARVSRRYASSNPHWSSPDRMETAHRQGCSICPHRRGLCRSTSGWMPAFQGRPRTRPSHIGTARDAESAAAGDRKRGQVWPQAARGKAVGDSLHQSGTDARLGGLQPDCLRGRKCLPSPRL